MGQMSLRKTRIDKGQRRRPLPSEREAWREYFARLPDAEKNFELGYLTALMDSGRKTLPVIPLPMPFELAEPICREPT